MYKARRARREASAHPQKIEPGNAMRNISNPPCYARLRRVRPSAAYDGRTKRRHDGLNSTDYERYRRRASRGGRSEERR